ncbi:MAG: HAMP domain-containing histidine kinase [Chlorobi bacterium]|nr:HAMP domain-containing histidine kinase [Chlorobiota bacterium]
MNLLTKTNLNFLTISLFIALLGTIIFYYLLREQVDKNINLELDKRKTTLLSQLESVHKSGHPPENLNEKIIINPLNNIEKVAEGYSDTILFISSKKAYVPYRQLKFITSINNQKYYVQIYKSLEETDLLIVRIFLIMTVVVLIIIATLLIMNRYSSMNAWKGFYKTIEKINTYNVNSQDEFALQKAGIKEFDELNSVLTSMTTRIKSDYLNLKEYTENASHEIQTPLAIINSKLELLMQNPNLDEKQYTILQEAHTAANRLSRLNKTLILLTKIENRQFPESENVNINKLIQNQLNNLEDILISKKITVNKKIENDIFILMNPYLAEIMILNLIKNAIRYNYVNGEIKIQIESNRINISNTSKKKKVDENKLFQRFYKDSDIHESTGLGLAIVKKIGDIYNFNVHYEYINNLHIFSIILS